MQRNTTRILTVIVFSQFAGTSLWFAANAVIKDMAVELGLAADVLSAISSAVQFGFISGTLLFAVFTVADRFSPSRIFFLCALAGALSNLLLLWVSSLQGVLASRFVTGLCLAGVYPIGMKIAADHHDKGLGKALGYLVGALVLGTAFPHLLNDLRAGVNWHYVIVAVSALAVLGGLAILIGVPDGPYRIKGGSPDLSLAFKLFRNPNFRSAAFGYFGHMWELYTFWAFVPVLLSYYVLIRPGSDINISVLSFIIIAIGSVGCIAGGYVSLKKGSPFAAFIFLLVSGLCCIGAYFFMQQSLYVFVFCLLIWGTAVVADSPQFTTLVAQSVDVKERGTALTIVNSIGFAITIVSIQVITIVQARLGFEYIYFFLAAGPLFGLLYTGKLLLKRTG